MKTLITLLLLLSASTIYAQKVKATRQGWSGGVCCRSGVNYAIVLTWKTECGVPKNFAVDSIYMDGLRFDKNMIRIIKVKNNISLVFEHSHDEENPPIEGEIMPHPIIGANTIFFNSSARLEPLLVEEVEELMYLAYP
ncbi:MAG: hypothetical protein V4638_12570 [Bacteroidota bacterium]